LTFFFLYNFFSRKKELAVLSIKEELVINDYLIDVRFITSRENFVGHENEQFIFSEMVSGFFKAERDT